MTKIRLVLLSFFVLLASSIFAQSLTITKPLQQVANSSVLALYKNQFGDKEKPDLDDSFPYVVIKVQLEGNGTEVKAAKKMLRLYLGMQTAVERTYLDNPNEILFLIPSRQRFIQITCGDGCEKQTLMDGMQLRSNTVYICSVHYVPEQTVVAGTTQAPKRQFFKFFVEPQNASVRVMVKGKWQIWPVEEGMASRALDHGKYKYEVSAENYQTKTGDFVVSDVSREMTVKLLPKFGWLHIESSQALNGAYVFATNTTTSATQPLGQLPLASPQRLDGATYQIEIQKEKYLPFSNQITILPGDTLRMYPQLVPNFGTVELTVEDNPETEIYLDGELLGKGKWNGTLESGHYSLESRREYHISTYTNIDVTAQDPVQQFTLNAPLPINGSLLIEGTPSAADVYVDGQMVGKTPYIVNQLLIGPHEVRIEKKGYLPYTEKITVEEGAEYEVSYTMKRGSLPKEETKPVLEQKTVANNVTQPTPSLSSTPADEPAKKLRFINTVLQYQTGYDMAMKTDSVTRRLSHNVFFGQAYNGIGWYLKGGSNFDFTKPDKYRVATKGGYVQGVLPYYTGDIKSTKWSATGGLLFDFTSMGNTKKKSKYHTCGIYMGAGYGVRNILWETTNGTWIKYGPDSFQGVCADAGVVFSGAAVTLSCGVTTIGFKYTELHFGAGVTF